MLHASRGETPSLDLREHQSISHFVTKLRETKETHPSPRKRPFLSIHRDLVAQPRRLTHVKLEQFERRRPFRFLVEPSRYLGIGKGQTLNPLRNHLARLGSVSGARTVEGEVFQALERPKGLKEGWREEEGGRGGTECEGAEGGVEGKGGVEVALRATQSLSQLRLHRWNTIELRSSGKRDSQRDTRSSPRQTSRARLLLAEGWPSRQSSVRS